MSRVLALLHAPAAAARGSVVELKATIAHPMETGYRRDGNGRMLPQDLVRRVEAFFEGQLFFAADLHAAIAAQPHLAFFLRLPGTGTVTVRWTGDRELRHEHSVRIVAT